MFERGLAYRRRSTVNWCPSCQTVLANEQVVDGGCWRCGTPVDAEGPRAVVLPHHRVRRRPAEGADAPVAVAREGADDAAQLDRAVRRRPRQVPARGRVERASRCSRRASTRSTARRSCCSAPEHPLVGAVCRSSRTIRRRFASRSRGSARRIARRESAAKSRRKASSPAATRSIRSPNEPVPVWVANFVLGEYGTGAVMAVPAHDERDFEFARKYDLPIRVVVRPVDGDAGRRRRDDRAGVERRRAGQLGRLGRPAVRRGAAAADRRGASGAASAKARCSSGSRTGASRGSATGARRFR